MPNLLTNIHAIVVSEFVSPFIGKDQNANAIGYIPDDSAKPVYGANVNLLSDILGTDSKKIHKSPRLLFPLQAFPFINLVGINFHKIDLAAKKTVTLVRLNFHGFRMP